MRFVKAVIQVVLFIIVFEIIAIPFTTTALFSSDEVQITRADYDFSFISLLNTEEERESEKSTTNFCTARLLDIQAHILQLENLHSTSQFQPIKTVANRYSLFRALLI